MMRKISLSIREKNLPTAKGLQENDMVKVILIQDSIREAEYMMYLFGKLSIINQIFWIRDSQEALDIIKGNGFFKKSKFNIYPKLIVCDLDMPENKKNQFLENIKEISPSNRISLIFLLSSIKEKGLGITKYKYLYKPINLPMLKEVVLRSDNDFILPTYWENPEIDVMYRII